MAALTTKSRNALPASSFAGPGRSYPVNDANHARNALARASQQLSAGRLSRAVYDRIVSKARAKLGTKTAAER